MFLSLMHRILQQIKLVLNSLTSGFIKKVIAAKSINCVDDDENSQHKVYC